MGPPRDIPDAGPLVTPFDEAQLGPASIDMRIGNKFESPQPLGAWFTRFGTRLREAPVAHGPSGWSVGEKAALREAGATGIEIVIEPGQVVACWSAEYYRLPPDVRGELYTRSSSARNWIDHSKASLIHPGFQGKIFFELVNNGSKPYLLRTGMSVVQIAFERMEYPPEVPYFDLEKARYRSQTDSAEGPPA
jgi:deoxycytidine triphosphate deaminase